MEIKRRVSLEQIGDLDLNSIDQYLYVNFFGYNLSKHTLSHAHTTTKSQWLENFPPPQVEFKKKKLLAKNQLFENYFIITSVPSCVPSRFFPNSDGLLSNQCKRWQKLYRYIYLFEYRFEKRGFNKYRFPFRFFINPFKNLKITMFSSSTLSRQNIKHSNI